MLPKATQELVNLRASQINGCGWCIDFHTKEAAAAGETAVRLNLVAAWRESTVFTEPEQAALALAEEGTRLADAHLGVSDQTWALVRRHYDDDQIAALVCLVALINAANRLAVMVHQKGGSLRARLVRPHDQHSELIGSQSSRPAASASTSVCLDVPAATRSKSRRCRRVRQRLAGAARSSDLLRTNPRT